MKQIYIFLLFAVIFAGMAKAQTCTTKIDKSIVDYTTYDITKPCVNLLARDNIVLSPPFSYSGNLAGVKKIVTFVWTYSGCSLGWTPSITVNSTIVNGGSMSVVSNSEYIASLLTLQSNLKNVLSTGWTVLISYKLGGPDATIQIENESDYTCSANYSTPVLKQAYVRGGAGTFSAKIDEKMVLDLGSGYLGSEIHPPSAVVTSGVVGCIAGSPSVTPTGGASYNLPLFVSPGTAGMQPSISIAYNSQGGTGLLGKSWDIAGLSAITRVPQTIYTDGQAGGVNLDLNDRFALDGNRLLSTIGTYGAQGTTYETQAMSFSKIETPTYSSGYSFKVSTKDGKILEYGNTDDSRAVASGISTPYMWRVNKITDANGNYMTFKYRNENGESVIDNIDYTGNTNAGLATYNQLQFYYERRNDKNTVYVGNASIDQTLILRQFKSICEGKIVRTYNFDYTQGTFSDTHLNKITETGSDGISLNPTVVNWGVSTPAYHNKNDQNFFDGKTLYSGDFNGDGRTDYFAIPFRSDMIYTTSDKWQLYITEADGQSFTLVDEGYLPDGFEGAENADFDNDGKDDLFFKIRLCWTACELGYWPYKFDGSKLVQGASSYAFTAGYNDNYLDGFSWKLNSYDFDGDGKLDYLVLDKNNNFLFFKGSSSAFSDVSFNFNSPDKVMFVDFNGDGKKDIMVVKGTNTIIYGYNNVTKTFTSLYSIGFPTNKHSIFTGDFNGDGKTDLLTWIDNNWYINYSTGTYFTTSEIPNSPITRTIDPDASETDNNYITADFNGDGKTDILEFYRINSTSVAINIYYSRGNGFVKEVEPITDNIDWILTGKYSYDKFDDLNGDGKADIFMVRTGSTDNILNFHADDKSNLVASITDGFKYSTQFNYSSLSTANTPYTNGYNAQFPICDIQAPIYVVQSITVPDGLGSTSSTVYSYYGAKIHKQGLGFLGFSSVTALNSVTDKKTTTRNVLNYTNYHLFSQYITVVVNSTGSAISTITDTFSNTQPVITSKAWFSYPSTVTETNNLTGVTVTTTSNYNGDVNGNIYTITKDYGGNFSETTKYENYVQAGSYTKADGTVLANKPQQITITRQHPDDANPFSSQTQFTYDAATGNVLTKKENTKLVTDKQITTSYSNYDHFGYAHSINTTFNESSTSEGGSLNQTKTYTYEPKGRFIETVTDPLMITTKYAYEPIFGNVTSEKLSNLANATTSTYDVWGRLTSKTLPDGNTVSATINWSSDIGAGKPLYFTTNTNSANSLWSKTWYDELGRTLKEESVGFNNISKYNTTQFKPSGQVDYKSSYLGTTKISQVTYGYCADGRVNTETNNITGATTTYTYTYGANNVKTTSDGKDYVKTFDNWGNLKQSDEPAPGGSIYYKYFSHGKPSSIQSPASTISMSYDDLGNQTSLTDPDAGTSTYRYDAMGRLTYQKDGNANETYVKYDNLGRIDHKEDGLHAVTYQYQYASGGGGLGKVQKITAPNNTYTSYTYDDLGREKTSSQYIDVANTNTYTNTYDQSGNISQVTYPEGSIVTNKFDAYGNLTNVLFTSADGSLTNSTVWTLKTLDANTMAYQLGNGLTTTKQYDANNFTLASIVTANGANQVQANYYNFNAVNGMLTSREDRRTGYALKETFKYDNLYRLTDWTVAKNSVTTNSYSLTFKQDMSGNLDFKSDAGTYSYNISGKPHQVGFMKLSTTSGIPKIPQNITYTDFNKVNVLTENNYELSFTYGPDQERYKSIMKQGGSTLYTSYYSGMYEKKVMASGVTTEYTYIPAGDGTVAVYIKAGGSGNLYYIHKDHLGSITALTNSSGTIAEQYAYDPWGRRRNPSDWSFTGVAAPTLFSRGFTGHEHIEELSLINMNGRMYDPVMGVFLSPDNFVQNPSNTQHFNRYCYAHGNPLVYTDPDGNNPVLLVMLIGFALMQADIAGEQAQVNGQNYWSGFGNSTLISGLSMAMGAGFGSISSIYDAGIYNCAITGGIGGALSGGAASAISGGDFWQGALSGGIGGIITGAIAGGINAHRLGVNLLTGAGDGTPLASTLTPDEYGLGKTPSGIKADEDIPNYIEKDLGYDYDKDMVESTKIKFVSIEKDPADGYAVRDQYKNWYRNNGLGDGNFKRVGTSEYADGCAVPHFGNGGKFEYTKIYIGTDVAKYKETFKAVFNHEYIHASLFRVGIFNEGLNERIAHLYNLNSSPVGSSYYNFQVDYLKTNYVKWNCVDANYETFLPFKFNK